MLQLPRSGLRYSIVWGGLYLDVCCPTWLLFLCDFNDLLKESLFGPLNTFPHKLYQTFDTKEDRNDHIDGNIDPDRTNHKPPSLIGQFSTSIKEASEHETWIGDSQDAELIEYLLEMSDWFKEGLVMKEVPEED